MDRRTSSRRRFLGLAAVGSGVSVAGCSGLVDDSPAATEGDGAHRRATLYAEPDQQSLLEARQEVGRLLQEENYTQAEAQEWLRNRREEIIVDAVGTVETAVGETAVTVEDTKPKRGALLLAGPATGLIDLLSTEQVGGLVAASEFESLDPEG